MAKAKDTEIKQVGRFGLVGILNTAVDFLVFNLLALAMAATLAGVISGTVAMINSYIFNQRFTFRAKKVSSTQTVAFFALTAVGIYLIRPVVIHFFTKVWLWPGTTAYNIARALGLKFSLQFCLNNTALVAAIAIVLVYNYFTYKHWVFNEKR